MIFRVFFLSACDSYTWRLRLEQTEGGIFKSTIDVTWLLPKANSLHLTNSHCLANRSPWVIILPLYQDTAWVKKPWGLLGLERHAITLEMNTATNLQILIFSCWLKKRAAEMAEWDGRRWKVEKHLCTYFLFLFSLDFNLSNLSSEFPGQ